MLLQVLAAAETCEISQGGDAQLGAQNVDATLHELASVVVAWPKLKSELRAAILAIVASVGPCVKKTPQSLLHVHNEILRVDR